MPRRRIESSSWVPPRSADDAPSPAPGCPSAGKDRATEPPLHSGHEAHVPPGRSRLDGPARPDEEPGPRPDDEPSPQLRPPATGPPLYPGGEQAARGDRHVRGGGAPDRRRDVAARHPRLRRARGRRLRPATHTRLRRSPAPCLLYTSDAADALPRV